MSLWKTSSYLRVFSSLHTSVTPREKNFSKLKFKKFFNSIWVKKADKFSYTSIELEYTEINFYKYAEVTDQKQTL